MIAHRLRDTCILVLGGTGFLGARIVRKLCKAGIKPHLLLRSAHRMERITDLSQHFQIHIGDLTDFGSLQNIISKVQPDIIFHSVGYGSSKGQYCRNKIFDGNLVTTHNLLMVMERIPNCHIIYSGTSLEQGTKKKPLQEEGAPNPVSFYAATKTAASILVRQAACYDKRQITIINPFAIYGQGEPVNRLIPATIYAGLQGKILRLTPPGFVRDFVFVDDVAEAYIMAALHNKTIGESIHIAGGKMVSNETVVALIEQQLGCTIRKQQGAYLPRKTDTTFWCADISKAKKLLGWKPTHSLQQGIKKTVSWFKLHGFHF